MSSSPRKASALERKLHQAALGKADKVISAKEVEHLVPDPNTCLAAVNFLLGTGLLVPLRSDNGQIAYRAVTQEELQTKKGLTDDEGLVLDRIRAAGDEGVWTKHIQVKAQLHRSVVDQCLKSLTKKNLVKTVPDVRYPTRKIYMLANLQPAAHLSGGPWYTDKELDTEFIRLMLDACLRIVQERSLPRSSRAEELQRGRLFPLSYSSYPTSEQVLAFLQKSRITETQLTIDHVEMLLRVLILDGKIEKIPAFRPWLWDASDTESEDEGTTPTRTSQKRKRTHEERAVSMKPDADAEKNEYSPKGSPRKRRRLQHPSDSPSESEKAATDPTAPAIRHRRNTGDEAQDASGVVYRAVHEERVPSLGINQTPCLRCEQFEFCAPQGPVNAGECLYYGQWATSVIGGEV